MLSWVVNSRRHLRQAACLNNFLQLDEKPVAASPFRFKGLRTLSFSVSSKSFACHSYENCRVCTNNSHSGTPPSHPTPLVASLYRSPAALFARSFRSLHQECFTTLVQSVGSTLFLKTAGVYPNSSHSRTRSCRGRAVIWALGQATSHGSPITSHLLRLTPSLSADTMNSSPTELGRVGCSCGGELP